MKLSNYEITNYLTDYYNKEYARSDIRYNLKKLVEINLIIEEKGKDNQNMYSINSNKQEALDFLAKWVNSDKEVFEKEVEVFYKILNEDVTA